MDNFDLGIEKINPPPPPPGMLNPAKFSLQQAKPSPGMLRFSSWTSNVPYSTTHITFFYSSVITSTEIQQYELPR